jgi:RNA recognition motif-containing protein
VDRQGSRACRGAEPGRTTEPERRSAIPAHKVFVGNLSYDTTANELDVLFSEVGQVVEVFLPSDRATGRPRGFAFVELAEEDQIAAAIEKLDGFEVKGRAIRVSRAEERPPRAPRPSFQGYGGDGGGGGRGGGGPRPARPKGSRRNIRGKKRSL